MSKSVWTMINTGRDGNINGNKYKDIVCNKINDPVTENDKQFKSFVIQTLCKEYGYDESEISNVYATKIKTNSKLKINLVIRFKDNTTKSVLCSSVYTKNTDSKFVQYCAGERCAKSLAKIFEYATTEKDKNTFNSIMLRNYDRLANATSMYNMFFKHQPMMDQKSDGVNDVVCYIAKSLNERLKYINDIAFAMMHNHSEGSFVIAYNKDFSKYNMLPMYDIYNNCKFRFIGRRGGYFLLNTKLPLVA